MGENVHPDDVLDGDSVDSLLNLLGRQPRTVSEDVSSNVLDDRLGAVVREREERGSLELRLGPLNLGHRGRGRHALPLLQGPVDGLVEVGELDRSQEENSDRRQVSGACD